MLMEEFNEWRTKIEKKLKVDMEEDDLAEKSSELIEASLTINRMLIKTLVRSNKIYVDYKIRYQKIYEQLKTNDSVRWGTAKEIESQIWRDKDYCKLHQQKADFDAVLKGIEKLSDIAKSNQFLIGHMIKYKMLQNGYA